MDQGRIRRILSELERRLQSDAGFTDDVTCHVEFFVKMGGLAGDVLVSRKLAPRVSNGTAVDNNLSRP